MKQRKVLILITIIIAFFLFNSNSYSNIIDDPKCNCDNCKCSELKCNNINMGYENKCMCDNCNCTICKCNSNSGSSTNENAAVFVVNILKNFNNTNDNSNINFRERCCHKTEINTGRSLIDTNLVCTVMRHEIKNTPVKFSYLGKEYLFCGIGCLEKFKFEPMNYTKEELLCPVMGDAAEKDIYTIHNGTKYYFCCKGCIKKFNKTPEKYFDGYKEN